jgi:hypothetical protein
MLDDVAQKRFLDARKHYKEALDAWHKLGRPVASIAHAFQSPAYASVGHGGVGWTQLCIVGQTRTGQPRVYGSPEAKLDPSSWPSGGEIASSWIAVNEAYGELAEAYKVLAKEDRDYLNAHDPQPYPNER